MREAVWMDSEHYFIGFYSFKKKLYGKTSANSGASVD